MKMRTIPNERRFYVFSIALLVILFGVTLVQNMIRYSHHDSYSLWTSVVYLCFSILFFAPFLVLCLRILKRVQVRFEKWFWPLTFLTAFCCLIVFYLTSNIILHSFGYFDFFVDADYAGYYFGREALYHLLFVLGTGIYVYASKEKTKTITVFKGRKTVTLAIDLIQWIEVEGHYLNFYTEKDTYIKRITLGELAKQLQPDFIRIHRKYMVNKNQIVAVEKDKRDEFIVLSSGKKLKIGPSYRPISW